MHIAMNFALFLPTEFFMNCLFNFQCSLIFMKKSFSTVTTDNIRHEPSLFQIYLDVSLALKKWKLQCPASKWDLIFPKADGRPQDRKRVWRGFDAAIKKANQNAREEDKLKRLSIHSLRHGFASIHLMQGTPITEVSEMLGHANVNITLTVYSHFIPKMRTDSTARFAASIFNSKNPFGDEGVHDKTTYWEKMGDQ